MAELREYGVETDFYFPLIEYGGTDFVTTPPAFYYGYTHIIKDGVYDYVVSDTPSYIFNGIFGVTLTSGEMQAKRAVLTVIDQGTKRWEDQAILIDTYGGGASSAHKMNLNTALPTNFDAMDISTIGYVSSNQMQVTSQFIELSSTVDANVVQVDGSDVELGTVLDANVTQISGDSTAADNAELFFDDTGFSASNSTIGTVTTLTNSPSNFTSMVINATTGYVSSDIKAISGDAHAANNAELFFDDTGFAASNSTIGTVTDVTNAVDLQVATQASIDAIETDTNEIQGKLPSGNIADESNVETHVTNSLGLYGVSIFDVINDTVNSNVTQISGDSTAADNLEALLDAYESGTAQAGGTNTITLATGANANHNFYQYFFVSIYGGVGAGQIGRISSYDGTSKIATMSANWTIQPDITSQYLLIPDEGAIITGTPEVNTVLMGNNAVASVWAYATRGLTEEVDADVTAISGDATAADNLEAMFDDTGFVASNSTIGTVTDVTNAVSVTGTPDVNVAQISGDSTAADNAELFFDDTGFVASNSTIGTVTDVTNAVSVTGTPDVNVAQISGDSTAADNLEAMFDDTGFVASNSTIGTVTTLTNSTGTSPAAIWAYGTRGLTEEVDADITAISGDATAADNLELFFDDTGFTASNSTIGTVTTLTNSTGTSPAAIWAYGTRGLTDTVNLSSATETQIDNIETDTSEIQGKLPTGTISDFDEASNEVDLGEIKGTALTESNAGNLANNMSQFYDVNPTTTNDVDDVGGGAGGTADWTDDEKEQIRKALGILGDTTATTGNGLIDSIIKLIQSKSGS